MVPPEDEEVFGILDLVGEEETDGLEGLLAAIDVIAEEEVVCFWREAAVLEQSEEVVVLAVDVTCTSRTRRLGFRTDDGGQDRVGKSMGEGTNRRSL